MVLFNFKNGPSACGDWVVGVKRGSTEIREDAIATNQERGKLRLFSWVVVAVRMDFDVYFGGRTQRLADGLDMEYEKKRRIKFET